MNITFDDRQVREALAELALRLKDMKPVMDEIGALLLASTEMRFRDQRGPDGTPWIPSKRATMQGSEAKRKKGAKVGDTLSDTRIMRRSLTQKGAEGNIFLVDESSVTVGTNVVYAATMQFGARKGEFGDGVANVSEHKRSVHFTTKAGAQSKTRRSQMVRAHLRYVPFIPWGDIPPRPFLGINVEDQLSIFEIINRHLALAEG